MNEPEQIQQLVSEFTEAIIQQTEAMCRADHRTGNKHAKRYLAAFAKLRAIGDPGRDALVPLLNHPHRDVRVLAASFLLRHKTEPALKVLEAAASGAGIASLGAAETLKRWREGTWTLDPPDQK